VKALVQVGEWAREGACAEPGRPRDAWTRDVTTQQDRWVVSYAKEVCWSECPVRDECLAHALVNDEWGVWGGFDVVERAAVNDGLITRDGRRVG